MKKARPGVIFYGPEQQMTMTNHRLSKEIAGDTANEIWNDWLTLRNYKSELDKKFRYQEKNDAEKNNSTAKNIKVNSSNATAQSRNEKVNETKKNDPLEDVYQEFLSKLRKLGYHDKNVLLNLNERLEKEEKENKNKTKTENVKRPQKKREITWQTLEEELNEDDEGTNAAVEEIDKEVSGYQSWLQ